MMKLTVPKRGGDLYYVTSESGGDQHIVVRDRDRRLVFYCDCRDFMVRKLCLLGTPEFQLCKHGQFVHDVVTGIAPDEKIVVAVRTTEKR